MENTNEKITVTNINKKKNKSSKAQSNVVRTLELDKKDVINLVMGVEPSIHVMDELEKKGYGHLGFQEIRKRYESSLEKATIDELLEIYKKIKK